MPEDALEGLRRLSRRIGGKEDGRRAGRHRASRRIRRRWPRRTLIGANVVSAILLISAGGAYGYVQWRLGQIKRVSVNGLHSQGHSAQSRNDGSSIAPFTLLAIGSDTRNLGAGSSAQFGSESSVQGSRSDSIILIRVVPKTRSLALLSIPRDTLVPVPGHGTTRINVAFDTGNPNLLITVLQQDFNIEVNHVVEFNFDTFQQVADAVGGVEQWFPAPAKDTFSLLNVPAGCVNLSGAQALGFVRSREYQYYLHGEWHYQLFPESDLARIQRQQAFTRDLVRKAKTKFGPTSVFQLNNLIGSVTQNLTVDKSFSNSLLLSLAQDFRSANLSTIPSYTFPDVNSTSVPGALDPQIQQGQAVIQQWLNVGQSAPPAPAAPSATTSTPPTTTVTPSSVDIEVLNGSGQGGQASTAGQELTSLGYHVAVSGDAPTFGLTTTEIEYAPDALAAAKQLQAEVNGTSSLVEAPSLTPTRYSLELVTGQSFKGINGAKVAAPVTSGGASTTTTTIASPAYSGTQTVNPDSSSVYDGVYVPPGLVPGQTPQTCGE